MGARKPAEQPPVIDMGCHRREVPATVLLLERIDARPVHALAVAEVAPASDLSA
jgi:hypothetical protein